MDAGKNNFSIDFKLPLEAHIAGQFISRGEGTHPTRKIETYEIIFVTQGILDIFEEDREYRMEPGSALLLFPRLLHGGVKNYPPDLAFFWIHFGLKPVGHTKKGSLVEIPKFIKIQNQMRMTELFRRYLDDRESGHQNPVQAALLIMQMLSEMSVGINEISSAGTQLSERVINYIKIHLREVAGIAEIAKSLKCNPDYLGRKFKETFGWTVTDEIHRQRINYAKKLLLESVMNVAEIATNSGFEDPVYFRKIFKRIAGISPRAYRRQYSRIHINTEYR